VASVVPGGHAHKMIAQYRLRLSAGAATIHLDYLGANMAKHITSERTYYLIFAALIALTLLTVGLSYVELGAFHLIVGLAIASTKAVLVILFFMHLLYSSRLSWTMFLSGLFWLGILLVLTLSDYLSRNVLSY